MKISVLLLILFINPFINYAQSGKDSTAFREKLLFNDFKSGTVLMKSGAVENALLNYNTGNQNFVFIQDGKYMFLTGTEMIDTIFIDDKKFVPYKSSMYEIVTGGKIPLYISYHNRMRPQDALTEHNGTSKKNRNETSNTVTDVYTMRNFEGNYAAETLKNYWIKKDNKFYKANTPKEFIKPFTSEMKGKIENYIQANKVDFNKEGDMIGLLDFCNGQI